MTLIGFPGIFNCRAAYCICVLFFIHFGVYHNLFGCLFRDFDYLSPYLTGMRQLETSSRIVRDYFATKINDINTTFTLQSH